MENPVKDITLKKMSCVNNKSLCLIALYYNFDKFILIDEYKSFKKACAKLKEK